MIATRLSSVWQVAGVAAAALCCYLASQSVAAERAALVKVDRQITAEQDAIVKLTTEITTRSRLTQVESWNRQLALQAPRPSQYVASGVQLASLYAHDTQPQLPLDPAAAPNQGPVQMAAYTPVPATRSPAAESPAPPPPSAAPHAIAPARSAIVQVAYHAAVATPAKSPAAKPASASTTPDQPLLRAATFVRAKASRLDDTATPAIEHAAFRPLPSALLSSDIASLAKAEQSKRQPSKPAE